MLQARENRTESMAVTADKPAPYAPSSAVLEIIERYRNRGLVFPVTHDVLARAGVSSSLIPRTMQALQTLDLFKDNGNPTETLEGIRLAPEAEYKKRLEDWIKGAYADVFAFVDPAVDDETRIRDAFRNYSPIAQQPRMVTLFKGLCTAAGIMSEKARTPRVSTASRPKTYAAPPRSNGTRIVNQKNTISKPTTGLPPALAGLLESLPSDGWTLGERDKFVTTFKAVLDYVIPVVKAGPRMQTDDQD
jgi:hypothetical protein